jgi:hypothetical protein
MADTAECAEHHVVVGGPEGVRLTVTALDADHRSDDRHEA